MDLQTSIYDLGFSTRTFNCLAAAKMWTLEDIVTGSLWELIHLRNMGRKSIIELAEVVALYGYKLNYRKGVWEKVSSQPLRINVEKLMEDVATSIYKRRQYTEYYKNIERYYY